MSLLRKLLTKRGAQPVRTGALRIIGDHYFTSGLEFHEVSRSQSVAAAINMIKAAASDVNDEPWFLVLPPDGVLDGKPTYWMYAKSRGTYWRSAYAIPQEKFADIVKNRAHFYIE
jgi:hypothetical protein